MTCVAVGPRTHFGAGDGRGGAGLMVTAGKVALE
jgi:hypothetical protein